MSGVMFRILLRLYPARVRREDGDAILETVQARLDAASGIFARLAAAIREAAGLILAALGTRLSSGSDPSRPRIPTRRARPMTGVLHDLRFALRTALRDPGYTAVVVITLALGIGANTAVFSVVHGVLLEPLPYVDSERLVRLQPGWGTMTKALQVRLRQELRTLRDVSAYTTWGFTIGGDDSPERVTGGIVSTNHFELLGVQPELGRGFRPEDAEPGNDDVAILSHELWQRRFGSDPDVLGRRVPLDNDQHATRVIVGVMPAGHRPIGDWELWAPYAVDPSDGRDYYSSWYLQLLGRLTEGADDEAATQEFRGVLLRLERESEEYGLEGFEGLEESRVYGLLEWTVGPVRSTLLVLLGAVALILLIACVNVANLQLARSTARRRELGVRSALGAPRGRLVRQLATESIALSLGGALVGVAGAAALLGASRRVLSEFLPRVDGLTIDPTVLAITALVAVLAGVAFGTGPAWVSLRRGGGPIVARGARGHSGGGDEGRASRVLVVAEVALACVVVVGAGLMVRTLSGLWSVPPGFDPEGVVTMRATAPTSRYADDDAQLAYWRRALERVAAVPGVRDSGAIHLLPLGFGNWSFPFLAEGQTAVEGEPLPVANFRVVTPGYFAAMGVDVVDGRDFDSRDGADDRAVVMVNRRMAQEYWPGESALGKRIDLFGNQPVTVVGVVEDVHQFGLDREPVMEMYRPLTQWPLASMVVVVRSDRPRAVLPAVRQALQEVDPAAPVFDVASMEEVVGESLSETRFVVVLLSSFAGLALLLGAVGVYGVMSYIVSWRTREIGIRMALGARSSGVQGSVIGNAMRSVVVGVVVGLAGAFAALRAMASLLYGVAPTDPVTYAAVAVLLMLTGVVAAWVPARRAARVDPLRALAAE